MISTINILLLLATLGQVTTFISKTDFFIQIDFERTIKYFPISKTNEEILYVFIHLLELENHT